MKLENGIYPYANQNSPDSMTDFLVVIDNACCAYDLYYTASYGFWNGYLSGDGKIRSLNDYSRIEDAVIASAGLHWEPIVSQTAVYPIPSEWNGCFPEPGTNGQCPEFTEWAKQKGIVSD